MHVVRSNSGCALDGGEHACFLEQAWATTLNCDHDLCFGDLSMLQFVMHLAIHGTDVACLNLLFSVTCNDTLSNAVG
jgi:hypothetical protein